MKRFACVLLFAVLAVCQSPNNKRVAKQDDARSARSSDNSAANQQQPPVQIFVGYGNPAAEHYGEKEHSGEDIDVERQHAKFTKYLVWVGLLQALILAAQGFLFFRQTSIMGEHRTSLEQLAGAAATNAEISAKTLVLTQRPRIVLRAFYFSEPRGVGGVYRVPKRIEAGSMCSGQFYIENCGGTDAYIQEIWCNPYIDKSLPMKRPYEGQLGSQEKKTLRPGQSTFYRFGLMEPLDAQIAAEIAEFKTTDFYVLGWIGYKDDLGIYRITAFCRRYDAAKDRLVPVDDPDYEYAD